LNIAAGSHLSLRLRDTAGAALFRLDLTHDSLTLIKLSGERHEVLKTVSLPPAPGAWSKLTLKFEGPELYGELDSSTFVTTDAVFERDKSELNCLISGGAVGFRNFSLTPVIVSK
jgi:hypothetical protein